MEATIITLETMDHTHVEFIETTVRRSDLTCAQIKDELKRIRIKITGAEFKNMDVSDFDKFKKRAAVIRWFEWIAEGKQFKNRMLRTLQWFDVFIDEYNKIAK